MQHLAKLRRSGGILPIVATYLAAVFTLAAFCLALGLQHPHDIHQYENLVEMGA